MVNARFIIWKDVLKRIIFLFSFLFLILPNTLAVPYVGADLSYQCIGGNDYTFKLTLYKACPDINPFPAVGDLQISSDLCGFNTPASSFVVALLPVGSTDISPLCPAEVGNSACNGGIIPGLEQMVYEGTVTLPANCQDWKIVWYDCCRDENISNLNVAPDPPGTPIRVEAKINNADGNCNNSPSFSMLPNPVLCNQQVQSIEYGINEQDGDSLVYKLVSPLSNSDNNVLPTLDSVLYQAPFSPANPFSATLNSFSLNPQTGTILVEPTGLQSTILNYIVEEYRNGVFLGSVSRDMSYIVLTNCTNGVPQISTPTLVSGGNYQDQSFSVCAGNTLAAQIEIIDPDPLDIITVTETLTANIPGAIVTVTGNNPALIDISWTTTALEVGTYSFIIEANDGSCPTVGQQAKSYQIVVYDDLVVSASQDLICMNQENIVQLTSSISNGFGNGTFTWSPATGLSDPSIANPIATISVPETYTMEYLDGACRLIASVNLFAEGQLTITRVDSTICLGDSLQINSVFTPSIAQVLPVCGLNPVSPCTGPSTSHTLGTALDVTGTTPNGGGAGSPFLGNFEDGRTQMVFRANELAAIGMRQGKINEISLEVSSKFSTFPYTDFTIKMGCSPLDDLLNFQNGLDVVFAQTIATRPGTNTFIFDTPYEWDGQSNLILEFCFNNPDFISSGYDHVLHTQTGFNSVIFDIGNGSLGDGDGCTLNLPNQSNQRPNIQFGICPIDIPVSYSWSPVDGLNDPTSPTPNASPASTTTYYLTATTLNCSYIDSFQVVVNDIPQIAPIQPGQICVGDSVQLNVSGQFFNGATFNWIPATNVNQPDDQNPWFSPSNSTNYLLSVTNACGVARADARISVTPPPTIDLDIREITCSGRSNGQITVRPSGGSGNGYTVNWAPLVNSGFAASNLGPGTYSIRLLDGFQCSRDTSVTLIDPNPLGATILDIGDASCNGGNDGYIVVQGNGGIFPYSYGLDGINFFTSDTIGNLSAGSYTVFTQDSRGCVMVVDAQVGQPDLLVPYVEDQNNLSCAGAGDGTFTLNANGGTLPYFYSIDGTNFGATRTFSALDAGSYTGYIRDGNGCIRTVPINITEPTALSLNISLKKDADCFGTPSGSISLSSSGGTVPYEFDVNGNGFGGSANFIGLPAGNYTFTVRDSSGCTFSINDSISEPLPVISEVIDIVDADCSGNATGSVSLRGSGGNPGNYLFSMDGLNFFSSNIFSGLTAGTYDFMVVDSKGCRNTVPAIVGEPDAITLQNTLISDARCQGESNGSLQVEAIGGTGPYSFSIDGSNFIPLGLFDSLAASTYPLSVLDSAGCLHTEPLIVGEPDRLTLEIDSVINNLCNGDSNGVVFVRGIGGNGVYQFGIDGGNLGFDSIFSNLASGNHILQIEDQNGCQNTASTLVAEPTSITSSISGIVPVDCYGNTTGAFSINATGGWPSYTYSVNGGAFTNEVRFENLAAGNYSVEIMDSTGCISFDSLVIPEPDSLEVIIDQLQPIDCNGGSNGLIAINGAGGSPNYQFAINGNPWSTIGEFSGLQPDNYTLEILDRNGCSNSIQIELENPDVLDVNILAVQEPTCNGDTDGSLSVIGLGGSPFYEYSINGTDFQQDSIIRGIPSGSYSVVVRDSRGCLVSEDFSVTEPAPLISIIDTIDDIDCYGNTNGSVVLISSGGSGNYTYSIDNGISFDSIPRFSNLVAGIYEIQVADDNGCSFDVPFTIKEPLPLEIDFDVTDAECFGESSGIIATTVTGGNPRYTFSWSHQPGINQDIITRLPSGDYDVEVTDENGCVITDTVTVNQPDSIRLVMSKIDELCSQENGQATVLVSGGVGPYEYLWSDPIQQITPIAVGLKAGGYRVVVTDMNNCVQSSLVDLTNEAPAEIQLDTLIHSSCSGYEDGQIAILVSGGTGFYTYQWNTPRVINGPIADRLGAGNYEVTVDDGRCVSRANFEIQEPENLVLEIDSLQTPSCFGMDDGLARVAAVGGTSPYRYRWNPTFQTTPVASSLGEGNYEVIVTDAQDCQTNLQFDLLAPRQLVGVFDQENISCAGDSTGSIAISIEGGTPPFDYLWSTGDTTRGINELVMGTYSLSVTDFRGCVFFDSLELQEPTPVAISSFATDLSCFKAGDGRAVVQVNGGTPPFSFEWSNGANTSEINNLSAGDYSIRIIDGLDCVRTDTLTINQPDSIQISLAEFVEPFCDLPNGSIEVLATGGQGPYSYAWNDGTSGRRLTDVFGSELKGPYSVTVEDATLCSNSLEVELSSIPTPSASFQLNEDANQPILLSRADLIFQNTSSGASSYFWEFGDGNFSEDINPRHLFDQEGEYTVTLTAMDPNMACPDDTTLRLNIVFDGMVHIPNAFSPNGDGRNDEFFVAGQGISSMELIIFNRKGVIIKRLLSTNDSWNGSTIQGVEAPEGVYSYVLKAVLNSGKVQDRGGTITLIR